MNQWQYNEIVKDLWKIYRLQSYEKEITAIRSEIKSLDPGKELKSKKDEIFELLEGKKQKLEGNKKKINSLNLDNKGLESQIKGVESKLYSGKNLSPKELGPLQKELGNLKKKRGEIDEETLTLIYENEDLEVEIVNINKEYDKINQDFIEFSTIYEDSLKKLNSKIEDIEAKKNKVIEIIEPELLNIFQEKQTRCGEIAIVPVQKDFCGGCGMTLSGMLVEKVRSKVSMECCEHCGRILYWEAEKN